MSASLRIVLVLAVAAVAGCSALPIVGGETATETPRVATPGPDEERPIFSDPPLPTFDQKTPRPTEPRSSLEMPECVDWRVHVDEFPGIDPLLRMSSAVVVARFEAYGEPRWNTPGGKRPTWDEYTSADYPVSIIRDVELDVDEFLRGTAQDLEGTYARGGQIGCDFVGFTNMPEFRPGDRAVFFFAPLVIAGLGEKPVPQLARVWLITEDGGLSPYSGDVVSDIGKLETILDDVPFSPLPAVRDALGD